METETRRRFLAALPGLVGGLAGCLGSGTGSSESSHSATAGPGRTIPDQAATDPPILFRRSDAERPPIRLTDEDTDSSDTDGDEDDSRFREHARHLGTRLIDDRATADRLVADSPAESDDSPTDSGDSQGGDSTTALSTFLSETDFENETLYLETMAIQECFRLSLCYVAWESDSVDTDYGRLLRPYDEQCTADRRVFESRLIRLPIALDADEISGFGSSTRGGRCRLEQRGPEQNRTDQPNESEPPANSSSASPNGSDRA